MKKILFITGGSDSGAEHNLFRLISTLQSEEADICVLTRYDDYYLHNSLPYKKYFSEESFLKSRSFFYRILDRIFYHNSYFPYQRFFNTVLKESKPDLIYCNYLTIPEHFEYFFNLNIPVIIHGHSLAQYYYGFSYSLLEKRLKSASLVLSCSQAQKEALRNLVPDLQTEVIYPPLCLDKLIPDDDNRNKLRQLWGIPENGIVWTMAATYFNYNKDPERFVEIGKRMLNQNDIPFYFLWIGGAENSTAIKMAKSKIKKLGLEKYFIFEGNKEREDYIKCLNASDGLLLVSMEESFSIVTAEALAMGKVAATFDCGGVREIITAETGCIVEPFSYDKMAESAVEISRNIKQYQTEKLRQSVEKFDLKLQSEAWKKLILNVK